jgi:hypothetical protein
MRIPNMAELSPFQYHVLKALASFSDEATRNEIRAKMQRAAALKFNKNWAKECGASTKPPVRPDTLEGKRLIRCTTPKFKRNLKYEITPAGRTALRGCP